MIAQTFVSLVAAASTVLAVPHMHKRADPKCTIVFDGRVPVGTAPTFFDTYATNTIFNPDYVKGNDLKWSQILKFPNTTSRFDGDKYTAVEVTLSDQSIFQKQNGFRRAGLQFLKDAADGEGGKGVKTLHWSVKQDPARPLNLTHEYLNVWHEAADYSNNQASTRCTEATCATLLTSHTLVFRSNSRLAPSSARAMRTRTISRSWTVMATRSTAWPSTTPTGRTLLSSWTTTRSKLS